LAGPEHLLILKDRACFRAVATYQLDNRMVSTFPPSPSFYGPNLKTEWRQQLAQKREAQEMKAE
jgi:hypothetical protein